MNTIALVAAVSILFLLKFIELLYYSYIRWRREQEIRRILRKK